MQLQYKTRGMSAPKGKPKVYFSCHPDDFETAWKLLSEDLLAHANCAVWYDTELAAIAASSDDTSGEQDDAGSRDAAKDAQSGEKKPVRKGKTGEIPPEDAVKENVLLTALSQMQLMVIAVTSRFLDEVNRARCLELPLALAMHVPVLPVMLESGLGYRFSKTCARIQVVKRFETDPTVIPYDEVLQTYLDSVLVGDTLAQQVRDAFDAYVFLSYRKKDRRHAQRLMRLIHENKEFRDIAIWYDEFLVPGESFTDAINDAFQKSSLFAMAVTPHLEEEKNYVMRVEYPMARDRQIENSRFEIVPVEMYESEDTADGAEWRINQDHLADHEEFKYRTIEGLKNEHRKAELDRSFLEALGRIAKKENDGSALHRFFIGLAYLNGIDTEISHQKALELLTSAATDPEPCMEATAKLADMYLNAEGVEADRAEAVRWQELLVSQYQAAYEKHHDPDEHRGYGTAAFKALRKLSDMYRDGGDSDTALDIAHQALDYCDELEQEVGVREQMRDRALILNQLGSLYRERGDLTAAQACFEQACGIYETQVSEIGTHRARRDLSISQERLGDLCRKRGDFDGAEAYYSKARQIREQLNEAAPSAGSRRDLSAILTKLGNVRKSEKRYDEAGVYYTQALDMDRVLAQEVKSAQAWDDYAVSLVKAGDIHKAQGRYEDASLCYEEASGIFRKNMEKTGSRLFRDHYAGSCEKLAGAKKKTGKAQEAGALYEESIALRERLYEAEKTAAASHALAAAYFNAGAFFENRDYMRKAYELWKDLSDTDQAYVKYRDKAGKYIG